ncbi:MAG: hypothetical protein ABS68_03145 [Niastella sp. SCN 39-18]|nr:TolC family protein [Sphingobacteriales bacterium]ODT53979.1 MAG: hypothetical protein ABS68_03145 [Niastella sp. SCN 39-18]OJW09865.1 MAG: hypothetical protein BGO53_08540 [Sphingobacteriales bacterium 39-19]
MIKKMKLLTCFFAMVMMNTMYAQPLLSLKEAIATTLQNNFDIRLLRNDSAVYALNNSFAKSAFLPRLNANTGILFNQNNQRQKLADGTKREANNIRSHNINSSVNLNWLVFDGFKMFITKDKLQEYVTLGNLALKNQVQTSIAQVINIYYGIVREKQQLKAIEEQMSLNVERMKQAEKKLSVGLGAKPELLQANLDLNAQKANRLKQLALIDQVKEQLNQLMALPAGTLYEVYDTIPINRNIKMGEILSTAGCNNTDLLLSAQNKRIAELTLKEKKADRYPTVSLQSAYNFSRTNNQSVINSFTPLLNQNFGFNYGATVTIPIFNNNNVKRQIKEAALDVNYQQLVYDYKKSNLQTAIYIAFKNYQVQMETLDLEEENIKLAKENVYVSMERNRLGITNILELRESQKSLEDAYNRLIAARYATKQAETELLRINGQLLPEIE